MSSTDVADQKDRDHLADILMGMYDFGRDERIADDEKIWLTKREAFLITEFIAWQAWRRQRDQDVPEEQQD